MGILFLKLAINDFSQECEKSERVIELIWVLPYATHTNNENKIVGICASNEEK